MTKLIRLFFALLWLATEYGLTARRCSYARNDEQVATQKDFHIPPNSDSSNNRSARWTNGNGRITRLKIMREKHVPSSVFKLRALQRLEVHHTCFEPCDQQTIPANIQCLASSLTELEINDIKLTRLPWQIGLLTNLKTLKLSHTGLTSLPDTIGHLSSLNMLYLSNNHLEGLPENIRALIKLTYIGLSNNRPLRSIQALNGLPYLGTIDAKNCSIEEIPHNLLHLTRLYLSQNNLTHLTYIGHLGHGTKTPKSFYFEQNRIEHFPSGLDRIPNLQRLKLDHNNLTLLSEDLYKIPSLIYLNIAFNRIENREIEKYRSRLRINSPKLEFLT